MTEQPVATVRLDFARDFCDRHREPLRAGWPRGAAEALFMLFDAFTEDPGVQAMSPRAEDGLANPAALPNLVAECRPLCCYLGDGIVAEIMAEALAEPPAGPRLDALRARQRARGLEDPT